jgi:aspartate ammonia-lyase
VEVHAILKAHAVNLEKIASDFRLLASDGFTEQAVSLPKRQVGSSIMPGKVNPVISEFVISVAHEVYASDGLITTLSAQGCLDLNAYLPAIGHHLIGSLKHLIAANDTLRAHLIEGVTVDSARAARDLFRSPVITTALLPFIGYSRAERLADHMRQNGLDVFEANQELGVVKPETLARVLTPAALLKLGYKMSEVLDEMEEAPDA